VEQELDRIGSAAHGVVTRAELLRAGISDDEIRHRLSIGALIRGYRGVYRVGHRAPGLEARYMAAVKACGEDAAMSGRLRARADQGSAASAGSAGPDRAACRGCRTHRSRHIQLMVWRGIPITTVARALVDIAGETEEFELGRACHEAGVRYRTTPREVGAVLASYPTRRVEAAWRHAR